MSILDVARQAAMFIGVARPDVLLGSTRREHVEMVETARDMAIFIAEAHGWQALKRLTTYTGNGETDAFDLPPDYDRMPVRQKVYTDRMDAPLEHVADHDEWLFRTGQGYRGIAGAWTLLGGQITFDPALADGETARFYYLSDLIWRSADGTAKIDVESDDDAFRLDERLLRLGVVWRWCAGKGMPYPAHLPMFEDALQKAIDRDAGSRELVIVGRASRLGAEIAYPGVIVP